MSNPLTAMLDELMGRNRNAASADEHQKETTWDDPEVCPYFVAGYCPHEMFTNTRADLGPCSRIHDDKLREQYKKSSRFEKVGLEEEFMEYLQRIQGDMRRKIDRNKQRLDLTQPGGEVGSADKDEITEKIRQLSEKITALLSQAEQLGEKGEVDEAQKVVKMMEELKEERDRLQHNVEVPSTELRSMEVCDICGCFLVLNDAQHRLDEHFTGKQHIGFAKIKATIEEIMKRKQEKREQRDKELRELREKEQKARSGSISRRDSRRSRSRDRSRRHNSKDKKNSSSRRSRSRDRKSSRKPSKDREKRDKKDEKSHYEKKKEEKSDKNHDRHRKRERSRSRSKHGDRKKDDRHNNDRKKREKADEKSNSKTEKLSKPVKEISQNNEQSSKKSDHAENGSSKIEVVEEMSEQQVNGCDDPEKSIEDITHTTTE